VGKLGMQKNKIPFGWYPFSWWIGHPNIRTCSVSMHDGSHPLPIKRRGGRKQDRQVFSRHHQDRGEWGMGIANKSSQKRIDGSSSHPCHDIHAPGNLAGGSSHLAHHLTDQESAAQTLI